MSKTSVEFCKEAGAGDARRDATLTHPNEITILRDIPYIANAKKWNLLDIYQSENGGKLPVIVNIHGGGYVYGTKEVYQYYCSFLATQGFSVINFNYHLAPKYKFPMQLSEINSVFEWIVKNANKYNFDLENVFVVGDSAGAQLCSQYMTIFSNPSYAKLFPFAVANGFDIRAIALNCGMYDLEKRVFNKENVGGLCLGTL